MEQDEYGNYVVDAAGLTPRMAFKFSTGPSRCGKIKDGVSFDLGDGCWVISMDSLREITALAESARQAPNAEITGRTMAQNEADGA